jgi:hypothetical protein
MIDREHDLPITRQAETLNVSRGSVYYLPRRVPEADLAIMRRLDRLHLEHIPAVLLTAEPVAPARQRAAEGQSSRLIDAAGDGTGEHIGGESTQLGEFVDRISERPTARGCGKHGVPVKWRMDWVDRAGEPVLGRHR